jgi:hypothetical protein
MQPPVSALLFALLLLAGMVIMLEAGRFLGVRRRPKESDGERGNLGAIEGAVFALFGLLMAFSFSGAAARFNEKRMLIAEEVNAIEVGYLRLQLVSGEARSSLQDLFRRYVESRLETYRALPDTHAAELEMANSKELQEKMWDEALAATRLPDSRPDAGLLLLPALNNMFDMMTTRTMALQVHPPTIVYLLLFALGLLCSLLAGYRMSGGKHRSWLHILAFTTITVIIVFVAIDIEYPRAGLIHLDAADAPLVHVRESMK